MRKFPPKFGGKQTITIIVEQPTLSYAVVLALAVIDADSSWNTGLAWAYVGLRIVHSLVQAIVNIIIIRFALLVAVSAVLFVLPIRAAILIFDA